MTWLDIVLLVVWITFLAVGARLGSVWIGSCVIGGFLGTFLADTYALPVSELIGGFSGSILISTVLLFSIGLALLLIPGWFLSKMTNLMFLGIIDSAVGLVTGGLIGLIAISLCFLLIVPVFPKVEKQKAWKKSLIVRPFHDFLEDVFSKKQFRPASITKKLKKETVKKVKPAAGKAAKKIKKAADEFIDDLKH